MAQPTSTIEGTDGLGGVDDDFDGEAAPSSYTSESSEAAVPARRPSASGPGAATGRRKEAIARVRIVPGSGRWLINGRDLETYFPNKVHQQAVAEPFTVLELTGAYDVLARVHGGGASGQAGALRLGIARCAQRGRRRGQPARAQAGRLPDPRRADQGAQEGRSEEGPQGSAVLQALTLGPPVPGGSTARELRRAAVGSIFGTDGVRGLANVDVTAELALDLSVAAAHVLGDAGAFAGHRARAVVGRDPRASGEFLSAAVIAGLASAGVDVLDAGILPTPALAFLTAESQADLGVMLSASHNPMPDNGIKFFARGGLKLEDDLEAMIESRLREAWQRPTGAAVGRVSPVPGGAAGVRRPPAVRPAPPAGRAQGRRRLRERRGERGRPAGAARGRRRGRGDRRGPGRAEHQRGLRVDAPGAVAGRGGGARRGRRHRPRRRRRPLPGRRRGRTGRRRGPDHGRPGPGPARARTPGRGTRSSRR